MAAPEEKEKLNENGSKTIFWEVFPSLFFTLCSTKALLLPNSFFFLALLPTTIPSDKIIDFSLFFLLLCSFSLFVTFGTFRWLILIRILKIFFLSTIENFEQRKVLEKLSLTLRKFEWKLFSILLLCCENFDRRFENESDVSHGEEWNDEVSLQKQSVYGFSDDVKISIAMVSGDGRACAR